MQSGFRGVMIGTQPKGVGGGIALILGIDRFMSEGRALMNFIGTAVATIVVARWEGELDVPRPQQVLTRRVPVGAAGLPVGSGTLNPDAIGT